MKVTATTTDHPHEVARRFAEWWAAPDVNTLPSLLHPEAVLEQPVVPAIVGIERAKQFFRRFLTWLPDARGEVHRTAMDGPWLFIDWTCSATVAGERFVLPIVDRIRVQDGVIAERRASYDSLRFMLFVLRRPRAWPSYVKFVRAAKRVAA